MANKVISQDNKQAWRNPWVLGWTAMVVIVLGANIGMITMAVVTNPGLVNEDYYEQGKQFERNMLSRREERAALNWQMQLGLPDALREAEPVTLSFRTRDGMGAPLSGADVQLFAYRPADASADFSVPLNEVEPGRYQARVGFPLKGLWDVVVQVRRDGNKMQYPKRIHVEAS